MLKRGAAYIRVSTEEQMEYSPQSQRSQITAYAESHGITLLSSYIYTDEGISGRNAGKRPAFQQMLRDAGANPRPFDVLLVWEFSRFARNREDSILYKSLLRKKYGIEVLSVKEPLSQDPTSVLVEALLEAMDEYYSLNLAQEVRRGMNEKFFQGGAVTIAPFGYCMIKGELIPDPNTSGCISALFQQYQAGKSLQELAEWLNRAGYRTRRGNPFEARSVRYILSNPVYIGKSRRNLTGKRLSGRYYQSKSVTVVAGKHAPIISEDSFYAVQQRLSQNVRSKGKTEQQREYMLHRLIFCQQCGRLLCRTDHGRALQCSSYAKGRCFSHYISLSVLNQAVIKQLLSDLPDLGFTIQSADSSFSSSLTVRRREQLQRKLSRLRDAYECGIETLEEYQAERQQLFEQLNKLERSEGERGARPVPPFESSIHQLLKACLSDQMHEQLKQRLLSAVVAQITISRPENTAQITYRIPSRAAQNAHREPLGPPY